MLISLLAATAALPDPNSGSTVGWMVLSLGAVAVSIDRVLSIFATVKKLRGVDPDTDKRYVSKEEFNALGAQVNTMQGQMNGINTTLSVELRSINRSLGRLEGAAGTAPKNPSTC